MHPHTDQCIGFKMKNIKMKGSVTQNRTVAPDRQYRAHLEWIGRYGSIS